MPIRGRVDEMGLGEQDLRANVISSGEALSEPELRFFFEASPLLMGAVELLDDGDILHLYDNSAASRFFGLPPGVTHGRRARDMGVPEATIGLWRARYKEAGRTKRPVRFEYPHEPWPGGVRLLAVTVANLPGVSGRRFSYVAEDSTERRLTEETLKRQETRLEMALEAAKMGDWSWDAATNLVTLSPQAADIFGIAPKSAPTWEEIASLIVPEDKPLAYGAVETAARGETYEIEYRVRRPCDGQIVWIGVRGRAVFDQSGRMVARLGMIWDQTRLKTIEAQLKDALESTTDSIFVLSPDWRFTYLNRRAVAQIANGRTLVGQNIWETFPEAVGGTLFEAYQRCMRERVQTDAHQFYEPLDRHFAARAFPTETGGVTVFFRDISDELAAAERLAEVESTMEALGEASPDLLYAKDAEGRMTYCNPACAAVIGKRPEDIIGRTAAEYLPDPAQAETLTLNDRRIMAESVSRSVVEVVTDARLREPRMWQSIKTPLRDRRTGEVIGLVGIGRDVTDQRRSEADLEARVEAAIRAREAVQVRLTQAEKLTALGQLAGGIAHDVNNVMQTVLSGATLIQRRSGDAQAVFRLAGMIAEAAERGASHTRRLLAYSRRGELKVEPVLPNPLLESLRELLGHTLGSEIRIEAAAEPDLPQLLTDRSQLETALINLATNARDAMPDGGVLKLAAARVTIDDGEPGGPPAGDFIRFAVEDTGVGIPPDVLPRVMEPFFTTKAQDKGTGLGLAMARSFAEQSGGGLTLKSEVGRGTQVRVYIPVATASVRAPRPGAAAPVASSSRIMVVDDDYLVRAIVAEQLREYGFEVVECEDAETALALLRSGEPVDAMVTDRSMPGLDGVSLIRQARALRPRLPAVLLTGFAGEADEIASGEFAVLRKPAPAAALLERLSKLLSG